MTIRRFSAAVVAAALIGWHSGGPLAGGEPATKGLTQAEFDKLHKELQPPKDELWRSIPWQVSIVEAQHAAVRAKKPIFVWVASGEPLGCG